MTDQVQDMSKRYHVDYVSTRGSGTLRTYDGYRDAFYFYRSYKGSDGDTIQLWDAHPPNQGRLSRFSWYLGRQLLAQRFIGIQTNGGHR